MDVLAVNPSVLDTIFFEQDNSQLSKTALEKGSLRNISKDALKRLRDVRNKWEKAKANLAETKKSEKPRRFLIRKLIMHWRERIGKL